METIGRKTMGYKTYCLLYCQFPQNDNDVPTCILERQNRVGWNIFFTMISLLLMKDKFFFLEPKIKRRTTAFGVVLLSNVYWTFRLQSRLIARTFHRTWKCAFHTKRGCFLLLLSFFWACTCSYIETSILACFRTLNVHLCFPFAFYCHVIWKRGTCTSFYFTDNLKFLLVLNRHTY